MEIFSLLLTIGLGIIIIYCVVIIHRYSELLAKKMMSYSSVTIWQRLYKKIMIIKKK